MAPERHSQSLTFDINFKDPSMSYSDPIEAKVKRPRQTQQPKTTPERLPKAPVEVRDRPFNGFRSAKTEKAKELVADVLKQLQSYEKQFDTRKRARKAIDQEAFNRQVEAIVCDLAHRELTNPGKWVSVPFSNQKLGKKDRYRPKALNQKLPDVVETLATPEMSFVEYEKGFQNPFDRSTNRQTTMRACRRLQTRIEEHGLGLTDFGLDKGEEIIIKSGKEGHWDKGKPIQYEDTEQTTRYRADLKRINEWLEAADIDFIPPDGMKDDVIDISARRLRRVFNNRSFDQGGRMYGAFWIDMKKGHRAKGLRINGSETITYDYSQMAPTILYGLAGVEPHFDDAYLLTDWEKDYSGIKIQIHGERYREGIKKVFNAMIHSSKPLSRLPKETSAKLPKITTIAEITDKISAFHAPIADCFYKAKGLELFCIESNIMVRVLLRLIDRGITALPVHDALIVAEDDWEEAKTTMLEVFEEVMGIKGKVQAEIS